MTDDLPTCFVIQSFDGGATFDRRYSETIAPALRAAGVTPQRADEILGLQPIVSKIEGAIRDASICVAEVSTDNPNVWLELGYALALDRPCIILCDKALRARLPFDIQHRPVIFYRADSKSGYDELERELAKNIKNELTKSTLIEEAPVLRRGSHEAEDLQDYEVAILSVLLAVWPTSNSGLTHHELERRLKSLGFHDIAVSLGLNSLFTKKYAQENDITVDDDFGRSYDMHIFQITPAGIAWLESHKDLLQLRKPDSRASKPDENDIPF